MSCPLLFLDQLDFDLDATVEPSGLGWNTVSSRAYRWHRLQKQHRDLCKMTGQKPRWSSHNRRSNEEPVNGMIWFNSLRNGGNKLYIPVSLLTSPLLLLIPPKPSLTPAYQGAVCLFDGHFIRILSCHESTIGPWYMVYYPSWGPGASWISSTPQ